MAKIIPMQHDIVAVLNQLYAATYNIKNVPFSEVINRKVKMGGEETLALVAYANILDELVQFSHALSDYYKEQQK